VQVTGQHECPWPVKKENAVADVDSVSMKWMNFVHAVLSHSHFSFILFFHRSHAHNLPDLCVRDRESKRKQEK
jgi:hypothetical protein